MLRSLYSGISGMKNFQTKLDVIGNNIANVNTAGFKKSRVTFKDTMNQTIAGPESSTAFRGGKNGMQIGLGSAVATIDTITTGSSLQTTGRPLDLGIDGDGYFIVRQGNQQLYTRAGNFYLDDNGSLVNADGLKVQAFTIDGKGNATNTLGDVMVNVNAVMPPMATTGLTLSGNLSANANIGSVYSQQIKVVDKNGIPRDTTIYFKKLSADQWGIYTNKTPDDASVTTTGGLKVTNPSDYTGTDFGQWNLSYTTEGYSLTIPGVDKPIPLTLRASDNKLVPSAADKKYLQGLEIDASAIEKPANATISALATNKGTSGNIKVIDPESYVGTTEKQYSLIFTAGDLTVTPPTSDSWGYVDETTGGSITPISFDANGKSTTTIDGIRLDISNLKTPVNGDTFIIDAKPKTPQANMIVQTNQSTVTSQTTVSPNNIKITNPYSYTGPIDETYTLTYTTASGWTYNTLGNSTSEPITFIANKATLNGLEIDLNGLTPNDGDTFTVDAKVKTLQTKADTIVTPSTVAQSSGNSTAVNMTIADPTSYWGTADEKYTLSYDGANWQYTTSIDSTPKPINFTGTQANIDGLVLDKTGIVAAGGDKWIIDAKANVKLASVGVITTPATNSQTKGNSGDLIITDPNSYTGPADEKFTLTYTAPNTWGYKIPGDTTPRTITFTSNKCTLYGIELDITNITPVDGNEWVIDAKAAKTTPIASLNVNPATKPDTMLSFLNGKIPNGQNMIPLNLTVSSGQQDDPDTAVDESLQTLPKINLDFSQITQNNGTNTAFVNPDGNTEGKLDSYNISSTGQINGVYSNGQIITLGQLALAKFSNSSGLTKVGGNLFQGSVSSGTPDINVAGNGRGTINSGSLEMSNVDLAEEFTEMITAQRAFQANTKIITTSDEILQELVNLKR